MISAVACTYQTDKWLYNDFQGAVSQRGLVKSLLCFTWLRPVCVFCVFGIFFPVSFLLSVPVQVIAWKDSSPKCRVMCREGCTATHSSLQGHLLIDLCYALLLSCYVMVKLL